MKKAIWILAILALVSGLWAGPAEVQANCEPSAPASAASSDQKDLNAAAKSGAALLDLFLDNLGEMGRGGTPEGLERRIQEMMASARKAREANLIDQVWFLRFNRMLAITKLMVTPDNGLVLGVILDDVLGAFVQDKLGHKKFDETEGVGPAIGFVAEALSVELINLQIYLDTAKERGDLQKKITERMMKGRRK
jgi:hypothetical protein